MSTDESWQVSNEAAIVYEQKFVPALFGVWAHTVAEAATIGSSDRILDVACGTGVLAREASRRVSAKGSVTGLDTNAGMLEVANRMAPEIQWKQGEAEALPFDDNEFNVVASQFGLMYFSDRVLTLKEMWRVLKPGGRLAVASWASFEMAEGYRLLAEIAREFTSPEAVSILQSPFVLGDSSQLLALYREAGIVHATLETHENYVHFSSIEEFVSAEVKGTPLDDMLSESEYRALLAEAEDKFSSFRSNNGHIAVPIGAHIVTARKPFTHWSAIPHHYDRDHL